MKTITVYDIEGKAIEEAADMNDTTEAEIIELLVEYLPQALEENGMKNVAPTTLFPTL